MLLPQTAKGSHSFSEDSYSVVRKDLDCLQVVDASMIGICCPAGRTHPVSNSIEIDVLSPTPCMVSLIRLSAYPGVICARV